MPPIKTCGIILNSRPIGELDRMVEIFSEEHGRIQGIAKGARSFKNRFGGSLEPFTYCRLNLFKKRNGALYRIESADIIESFQKIRSDLTLLLHSSCMVDTLRKLIPFEDPSKAAFSLLYKSIGRMTAGEPSDKVLSYYQIRLLHLSGVGPRLDSCIKCSRTLRDLKVALSIAEGGPVCAFCRNKVAGKHIVVTGATIAIMRSWQSASLDHVKRFILTDHTRKEIREILDMYTTYLTGKKSIDVEGYLPRQDQPS